MREPLQWESKGTVIRYELDRHKVAANYEELVLAHRVPASTTTDRITKLSRQIAGEGLSWNGIEWDADSFTSDPGHEAGCPALEDKRARACQCAERHVWLLPRAISAGLKRAHGRVYPTGEIANTKHRAKNKPISESAPVADSTPADSPAPRVAHITLRGFKPVSVPDSSPLFASLVAYMAAHQS